MHKMKQIKLQFRKFPLSKRNENFQNYLRSDRTKNRHICKGTISLMINQSEKGQIVKKTKTLTPAVSLHRRIAHLGFHYTEE